MRVVFPPSVLLLVAAACAIGSRSVVSAWTTSTRTSRPTTCSGTRTVMRPLRSTPDDNNDKAASDNADDESADAAPPPSLVLGDGLGDEMAKLRSKYPTSEADYLAAARARNAAKQASTSHGDEKSWKQLADEKKRAGEFEDDAWEASRQEAGNADSQILIPMMDKDEDSDSEDNPEEPKLLLW